MLSSVYLSGRLGQVVEPRIRYVELDRVVPGPSGRYSVDQVLVRTDLSPEGAFMKSPAGSLIVLKGRLEVDPKHGLLIVNEIDEIFPLSKNAKRI